MNAFELTVVKFGTSIYLAWLGIMLLMNLGVCLYAMGWYEDYQNSKLNFLFIYLALWISEMGYTSFLVYTFGLLIIWGSIKFEDPLLNLVYIWGLSGIMHHLPNEKGF